MTGMYNSVFFFYEKTCFVKIDEVKFEICGKQMLFSTDNQI
jgi:hypothetical protein